VTAIEALGASVVAVTPEVRTGIRTLPPGPPFDAVFDQAGLTARTFAVVIDRGNTVARQYGLVHGFPPELRALYLQFGIDLAAHNGDDSWTLPLPATFVIDRHGIIRSADVRVDYRHRAEPAETLAVLRQLRAETLSPRPSDGRTRS
jgi:alkyl hydroperoxide reductase subunit AhpC